MAGTLVSVPNVHDQYARGEIDLLNGTMKAYASADLVSLSGSSTSVVLAESRLSFTFDAPTPVTLPAGWATFVVDADYDVIGPSGVGLIANLSARFFGSGGVFEDGEDASGDGVTHNASVSFTGDSFSDLTGPFLAGNEATADFDGSRASFSLPSVTLQTDGATGTLALWFALQVGATGTATANALNTASFQLSLPAGVTVDTSGVGPVNWISTADAVTAVPGPTPALLLLTALAGFGVIRRRA